MALLSHTYLVAYVSKQLDTYFSALSASLFSSASQTEKNCTLCDWKTAANTDTSAAAVDWIWRRFA